MREDQQRDWGKGIPVYQPEDVLPEDELFAMAVEFVIRQEVTDKGYELVASSANREHIPNIVFRKEKEGRLQLIDVEAAISPHYVEMDTQLMGIMLDQAKKFDARAWFASVAFGSKDRERFEKGLALRGDSFRIRYEGLKKIIRPIF